MAVGGSGRVKVIYGDLHGPNAYRISHDFTGIIIWSDGDVLLYENSEIVKEPAWMFGQDGKEYFFLDGEQCTYVEFRAGRKNEDRLERLSAEDQRAILQQLVVDLMGEW